MGYPKYLVTAGITEIGYLPQSTIDKLEDYNLEDLPAIVDTIEDNSSDKYTVKIAIKL